MSGPEADLEAIVHDRRATWARFAGAGEDVIRKVLASCTYSLPSDYVNFLRLSNGGEGPLPVSPLWFQLWRAEELLDFNKGYGRDEFYPELFLIGSSGGGSLIAFELLPKHPWPVVAMDWYDSKRECVDHLAPDFRAFLRLLGHEERPVLGE